MILKSFVGGSNSIRTLYWLTCLREYGTYKYLKYESRKQTHSGRSAYHMNRFQSIHRLNLAYILIHSVNVMFVGVDESGSKGYFYDWESVF